MAAGCWLLAAGCWLLAAGCWLLAAGKTETQRGEASKLTQRIEIEEGL
jgi:hypothetical protein